MIKGIGVDSVSISRMEKAISHNGFTDRFFSPEEIASVHGNRAEYYATRFACKEALVKALHNKNIDYVKISTLNNDDGSPYFKINDCFRQLMVDHSFNSALVSITTENDCAIAFVVVE